MARLTESTGGQHVETLSVTGDTVQVPDARLLFEGEFGRAGHDLLLSGRDGSQFLIEDYFQSDAPPALAAASGARLDGGTVSLLAGPQFPGQYAQAAPGQGDAPVGEVSVLEGAATVQRADGTVQELQVGDPVFRSDVLSTADGATLAVRFEDGTVFHLQADTRMVVNELVYDPGGSSNSALFDVLEGTFSMVAGEIAPSGDMQVRTPIATMGIRGTSTVGVNVDGDGWLAVTVDLDGHVGLVGFYNNETQALITTVNSTFSKVSLENGQVVVSPLSPEELALNQSLTDALHETLEDSDTPQTEPGQQPVPQSAPSPNDPPGLINIDFDADTVPMLETLVEDDEGDIPETLTQILTQLAEQLQEETVNNPPTANPSDNSGDPVVADGVTPGNPDADGNVLDNDADPDDDPVNVVGVAAGDVDGPLEGGVGTSIQGQFGTLVLAADGTWDYALDPALAAPLAEGEVAQDIFTYTIADPEGLTDTTTLTIDVTGVNDAPVIELAQSDVAGIVTESGDGEGNENNDGDQINVEAVAQLNADDVNEAFEGDGDAEPLMTEGVVAFSDVDLTDTHTASVAATDNNDGYVGEFTLGPVDQDANIVPWTFTVADADIEHLAAGEEVVQTYTVVIDDGHGGTAEQEVTVTLTGANETPVVEEGDSNRTEIVYMTGTSDPWGTDPTHPGSPDSSMNTAFGENGWTKFQGFTTTVFESDVKFIYIDGGDGVSQEFDSFISENIEALESFVQEGGNLFINAARWTTDDLLLGFGATMEAGFSAIGEAVDAEHPVFNGPHGSAGASWSGNWFSHDIITGDSLDPLITGTQGTVLAELQYGAGTVYLGGMTNPFFQSPAADAETLRANILSYAADQAGMQVVGTVRELEEQTGSDYQHATEGVVAFSDVDVTDTHTASVAATGANDGYVGEFTLGPVDQDANTVPWTFTVDDADIDHLAEGAAQFQTYTVVIDDGQGGTAEQEVTVTLAGANDAPEAVDDSFAIGEDAFAQFAAIDGDFPQDVVIDGDVVPIVIGEKQCVGNVLENDTDVDGDELQVTAATKPVLAGATAAALGFGFIYISDAEAEGDEVARFQIETEFGSAALAVSPNGEVHMWATGGVDPFAALGAGQSLPLEFTYDVSDPEGLTDTATAIVDIEGANDVPVAGHMKASEPAGSLLGYDVDNDATDLEFALVGEGGGNLSVESDGSYALTEMPFAYTADQSTVEEVVEPPVQEAVSFTIDGTNNSPPGRELTFEWEGLEEPISVFVPKVTGPGAAGPARIQALSDAIADSEALQDHFDITQGGADGRDITLIWKEPGDQPDISITTDNVDIGGFSIQDGSDAIVQEARTFTFDWNGDGEWFGYTVTDGELSDVGSIHFLDRGGDVRIENFVAGANGDVLDFRDILIGAEPSSLDQFFTLDENDGDTVVNVDRDGAGDNHDFQPAAVLEGTTGLDLETLIDSGNIQGTDQIA